MQVVCETQVASVPNPRCFTCCGFTGAQTELYTRKPALYKESFFPNTSGGSPFHLYQVFDLDVLNEVYPPHKHKPSIQKCTHDQSEVGVEDEEKKSIDDIDDCDSDSDDDDDPEKKDNDCNDEEVDSDEEVDTAYDTDPSTGERRRKTCSYCMAAFKAETYRHKYPRRRAHNGVWETEPQVRLLFDHPGCRAQYASENRTKDPYTEQRVITKYAYEVEGIVYSIVPAPPRQAMYEFGGPMTRKEWNWARNSRCFLVEMYSSEYFRPVKPQTGD
jgi:hypothetical protein